MDTLKRENERLKLYLAEAIGIANFTVINHGLFVKQQLWNLKLEIDKSEVAKDCDQLIKAIKAVS